MGNKRAHDRQQIYNGHDGSSKIVVYSAITGGKDSPRDDVVVLSDYDRFKSDNLNAKIYKVLPHLFFPEAEWTIWIDGNIELRVSPEELVEMVGYSDVGVFSHPERDNIEDESKAVIKMGKDTEPNVKEQMSFYRETGYEMNERLAACFILVRKNCEKVNRRNEEWWAHITRFSQRDQLSFPVVFGDIAEYIEIDNITHTPYFSRGKHAKNK